MHLTHGVFSEHPVYYHKSSFALHTMNFFLLLYFLVSYFSSILKYVNNFTLKQKKFFWLKKITIIA